MTGASFGKIFRLTTFGESHGKAIGGVIDGVPSGVDIDLEYIQRELARRRPGQSFIVTQRKESDEVEILSGLIEGKTTGMPIGFVIRNKDQKGKDYDHLKDVFRPSHADNTYQSKFGIRDHRGGGRSSARETASWVVAGAIAQQILAQQNIKISAYVDQVGHIRYQGEEYHAKERVDQNIVRCPDEILAEEMIKLIKEIRADGDTIGGAIRAVIENVPAGLGEPVFEKLHAVLGHAMFSINAVKAVEFGSGYSAVGMRGSEHNDIITKGGKTTTNNAGGIQGGISNGMPIKLRVAFKPVATLMKNQQTINSNDEEVEIQGKGRHDPCVVPRAVPIVEALCAMVILDHLLIQRTRTI